MSDNNSYEPANRPEEVPNSHAGGSLEQALAGDFEWTIGGVISEAWDKQSGFKLTAWGCIIVYYVILMVVNLVLNLFLSESAAGLGQFLAGVLLYPLAGGIMMVAIRRAANEPARVPEMFDYFGKALPIILLYLLMALLVMIGLVLLVIPGVYLMVAYTLALPLMVEKNLGVWESLETSRKVITKCWFRMFGLMIVMTIIIAISAIPLGIGLIWTLPMMLLVLAIVYRDIFGIEATPAATPVVA